MTRYAMVADLERCVGCQTCTAACRHANATSPAVQWRRVLDVEAGEYPDVSRVFVPVGCQHCSEPPCMHVCPTTATRQRDDGIVTIDYDLCIGCTYCEVACPYQARFLVDTPAFAFGVASPAEAMRTDSRRHGVSQKCTFCSDRIDEGLSQGLVPGVDAAATPACANACIAKALIFGDLDDPASPVSRLLAGNKAFRMHEELGTGPGFYYLEDHRHIAGRNVIRETDTVRGAAIDPPHQAHWDWKAAMNFLFGGLGSSLIVLGALSSNRSVALAGLLAVAVGLFTLLFKIGRPLRFLNVLRQPKRSWMSREAWIAAALFPATALYAGTGWVVPGAVCAVIAAGFLFAQAMILRAAKGVPAWRLPQLVPFIVTTGATEGIGAYCLVANLPMLLAVFVALRGWAWVNYRTALEREGAPAAALEVLARLHPWMIWAGAVLPLSLCLIDLVVGTRSGVIAGPLSLATGWAAKFVLVTRAGYLQGFALSRCGSEVKIGWAPARTRI